MLSDRLASAFEEIMGILKAIGDFLLITKTPDIFDENGQVLHRHPKKKWDNWQNRYKNDANYNWRHHSGLSATGQKPENQTKKN